MSLSWCEFCRNGFFQGERLRPVRCGADCLHRACGVCRAAQPKRRKKRLCPKNLRVAEMLMAAR